MCFFALERDESCKTDDDYDEREQWNEWYVQPYVALLTNHLDKKKLFE